MSAVDKAKNMGKAAIQAGQADEVSRKTFGAGGIVSGLTETACPPWLSMGTATGQKACYLVEWYREEAWQRESFTSAFAHLSQGAELLTEDGLSATVLMTLAVPTDDAIFCVFAATSAEGVTNACSRAVASATPSPSAKRCTRWATPCSWSASATRPPGSSGRWRRPR